MPSCYVFFCSKAVLLFFVFIMGGGGGGGGTVQRHIYALDLFDNPYFKMASNETARCVKFVPSKIKIHLCCLKSEKEIL